MLFDNRDFYTEERLDGLWRFASSILLDSEEARDVVQDVLAKILAHPFPVLNPEAYLVRSVRNACIDRLRLRKDFVSDLPEEPAESCIERMNAREIVRYAMKRLPQNQRMIVHLKDIEGYSSIEIAGMMGMSDSQVRVILSRARKAMRVIIEKELHYEA